MKSEYLQKIIGTNFIFDTATKRICVHCYSKSNRNGFKHYTDFISIDDDTKFTYPLDEKGRKEIKVQYYNRTWERFTFQSLLYSVLEWLHKNKYITDEEYKTFKNEIE